MKFTIYLKLSYFLFSARFIKCYISEQNTFWSLFLNSSQFNTSFYCFFFPQTPPPPTNLNIPPPSVKPPVTPTSLPTPPPPSLSPSHYLPSPSLPFYPPPVYLPIPRLCPPPQFTSPPSLPYPFSWGGGGVVKSLRGRRDSNSFCCDFLAVLWRIQ